MGMSAKRVKQMADILNGKAQAGMLRPEKQANPGRKSAQANMNTEKKGA